MPTVATLIQIAKGQYGRERSATEDELFTDSLMIDFVNAAHKTFAALSRCYMSEITLSLLASTVLYALSEKVIEIDPNTVRTRAATGSLDSSGAWTVITFKHRRSLIQSNGAPESWETGTPANFFLLPGATADQTKRIGIYPPPGSVYLGSPVGTNNLRMDAWVYPDDLAADGTPQFAEHEHYRLIPGICRRMAETELSRGRQTAPVDHWLRMETTEALEFRDIIRRGMEEIPRTATGVGATALDDAHERRFGTTQRREGR